MNRNAVLDWVYPPPNAHIPAPHIYFDYRHLSLNSLTVPSLSLIAGFIMRTPPYPVTFRVAPLRAFPLCLFLSSVSS